MSTNAIKRRALQVATMHQAQPSRLVHSSAVNQATALPGTLSPSMADLEQEEIVLAPIFDIFDAPSRLSESSEYIREKYISSSSSSSSSSGSSRSRTTSTPPEISIFGGPNNPSKPLPTSLPAPITFDGPARPQNATLAMRSRMRQAGMATGMNPASRPHHRPTGTAASATRSFSSSEPLVQMFDGPARITRYHHQPSGQKQNSSAYLAALGVAASAALGCTALSQNDTEANAPTLRRP